MDAIWLQTWNVWENSHVTCLSTCVPLSLFISVVPKHNLNTLLSRPTMVTWVLKYHGLNNMNDAVLAVPNRLNYSIVARVMSPSTLVTSTLTLLIGDEHRVQPSTIPMSKLTDRNNQTMHLHVSSCLHMLQLFRLSFSDLAVTSMQEYLVYIYDTRFFSLYILWWFI